MKKRKMPKPKIQNKNVDSEWFVSELSKLGKSQRDLARYMDLDPSLILHLIRGRRKPKATEPHRLAKFFGVPVSEVYARFGLEVEEWEGEGATLAVECFLDGSLMLWRASEGEGIRGKRTVAFPFRDKDIAVARCQTSGSPYAGLDGTLVFFRRRQTVDPEAIGRTAMVQVLGESRLKLRTIQRGFSRGRYHLSDLAGKIIEEDVRLKSTSPIVWMKL